MTEAERKALAVFNAVREERGFPAKTGMNRHEYCHDEAFCRLSEQLEAERAAHAATKAEAEAFRREVSDAVEKLLAWPSIRSQGIIVDTVARFILTKSDPLVEALNESLDRLGAFDAEEANNLRAALAARGGRIVFDVEDSHD